MSENREKCLPQAFKVKADVFELHFFFSSRSLKPKEIQSQWHKTQKLQILTRVKLEPENSRSLLDKMKWLINRWRRQLVFSTSSVVFLLISACLCLVFSWSCVRPTEKSSLGNPAESNPDQDYCPFTAEVSVRIWKAVTWSSNRTFSWSEAAAKDRFHRVCSLTERREKVWCKLFKTPQMISYNHRRRNIHIWDDGFRDVNDLMIKILANLHFVGRQLVLFVIWFGEF